MQRIFAFLVGASGGGGGDGVCVCMCEGGGLDFWKKKRINIRGRLSMKNIFLRDIQYSN